MANSARSENLGPRAESERRTDRPGPTQARSWNEGLGGEDTSDHDGWVPGPDACDAPVACSGLGPTGWRRADACTRDTIMEHLLRDRILDASGIDVHVEENVITLGGVARHASDVRLAEMLTREVCPNAEVRNRLRGPETP
jgi:hypothetical protein